MELGNLIWGNSRGEYEVDRDLADIFWAFFEDDFDYHCYYFGDNPTERGGYENEVFSINPYYWGDDEDIADLPNFVYKPEGITISWYKYPFRDSYSNIELTKEKAREIFSECARSIK